MKLHTKHNVPLANVHLIGHSLGAHIVGFAGKEVLRITGKKIEWITGLDPAGPLFEVPLQSKPNRLSNEDARYVEVIHSNGGVLGFISPLGDSDFYPNGGKFIQPGCNVSLANIPDAGKLEALKFCCFSILLVLVGCSHMLSTDFYTDAVKQGGVTATKCISWEIYLSGQCKGNEKVKYGAEKPPKARGTFYNVI